LKYNKQGENHQFSHFFELCDTPKFNILFKSQTLIMSSNKNDGTLANTAVPGALRFEPCKCLLFWTTLAKFILHKWVKIGHVCQKDCVSLL